MTPPPPVPLPIIVVIVLNDTDSVASVQSNDADSASQPSSVGNFNHDNDNNNNNHNNTNGPPTHPDLDSHPDPLEDLDDLDGDNISVFTENNILLQGKDDDVSLNSDHSPPLAREAFDENELAENGNAEDHNEMLPPSLQAFDNDIFLTENVPRPSEVFEAEHANVDDDDDADYDDDDDDVNVDEDYHRFTPTDVVLHRTVEDHNSVSAWNLDYLYDPSHVQDPMAPHMEEDMESVFTWDSSLLDLIVRLDEDEH